MPNTSSLIRGWRITRVVIHVLTGITLTALVVPLCSQRIRLALTRWWCRRLLHCFNITLTTSGTLPDASTRSVLFVANHISWTDIYAINSILPVRFIAKMEINDWPVLGYLVRKSGTIFINRGRQRDAARVIEVAKDALVQGDNLCVFPEGTTTEGCSVLPFKSSLIQSAIDASAMIAPVVIRYPLPDGSPNLAAAYAGETTMAESMRAFLNMRAPAVHLHFCQPISATGMTRQSLAEQAHAEISNMLVTQNKTAGDS